MANKSYTFLSRSFIISCIVFICGEQMKQVIALAQGIYFLISGIWPILNMRTFLKITGPKTELWLVKTVGLLVAAIGAVLIFAQINAEINTATVK